MPIDINNVNEEPGRNPAASLHRALLAATTLVGTWGLVASPVFLYVLASPLLGRRTEYEEASLIAACGTFPVLLIAAYLLFSWLPRGARTARAAQD